MQIRNKSLIRATPEQVWKVLAESFGEVDRWAATVTRSESPGGRVAAALGTDRSCATPFGRFQETVTHFDEAGLTFRYRAHGGPPIMKEAINTWLLTPVGDQTEVTSQLEMRLLPVIGSLMKPLMRRQMGRAVRESIDELKHFVETGSPHPRKQAAIARGRR